MITLGELQITNFKRIRSLCITFPRQGTILVEGPNESGKSTLFEAIYFALYGQPIVTETNRKSLDDLITYGENQLRVKLSVHTDKNTLYIDRTVKRSKGSTITLRVMSRTGREEVINSVRAANSRIVQELGGIDGSALLNSCLVEQKKLSKLEELDAKERRDSLMKILNLEKLSYIEDRLRVSKGEIEQLDALKIRYELANCLSQKEQLLISLQELEEDYRNGLINMAASQSKSLYSKIASAKNDLGQAMELQQLLARKKELEGTISSNKPNRSFLEPNTLAALFLSVIILLVALFANISWLIKGLLLIASIAFIAYLVVSNLRRLTSKDATSQASEAQLLALDRKVSEISTSLGLKDLNGLQDLVNHRNMQIAEYEAQIRFLQTNPEMVLGVDLQSRKQKIDQIKQEIQVLDHRINWLRSEIPSGEENLRSPQEYKKEIDRLEEDIRVREIAVHILQESTKRIISNVLPDTERNMNLLLPVLTAGRYHDARISEDYKIEVWDEEAGRYVGKNIFSGGTKDQMSLALRLAFAIASLPQERGTSPGFLFMDEPLSSFDEERTQSLIDLVTIGELAKIFPQICIISHSKSFDPGAFQYFIRMEDGRVTSSNLSRREELSLA